MCSLRVKKVSTEGCATLAAMCWGFVWASLGRKARQISEVCAGLSDELGRPISSDRHLVGSLGGIYARDEGDLELAPPSTKGFDATRPSDADVTVEIKATINTPVTLSVEHPGLARQA